MKMVSSDISAPAAFRFSFAFLRGGQLKGDVGSPER